MPFICIICNLSYDSEPATRDSEGDPICAACNEEMDLICRRSIRSRRHPETREGEFFLTNAGPDFASKTDWKVRQGSVAYDIHGRPLDKGLYPLYPYFATLAEAEESGWTVKFLD